MADHPARAPAWIAGIFSSMYATNTLAGGAPTDAYDDITEHTDLDAHGLIDLYAAGNAGQPDSGTNALREFDTRANAPSVGFARVTLAHRPETFGFRIDAGLGDTADAFYRSDPAANSHPDLARAFSFVEQAFVSAVLARSPGVRVDVGKFGTPIGFEDNESPTNWNYSRSFLYSWAEPSLHVGARASIQLTRTVAVGLFWLNGWNANLVDGNGMRSYAAAVSWHPRADLQVSVVYAGGLERAPTQLADPSLYFRTMLDAYVTYTPSQSWSFALSADYGNGGTVPTTQWWGIAAYARWRPRTWLAVAAREELVADPDGFITGTRQTLAEGTVTLDASTRVSMVALRARLEYRHDQSTTRAFDQANGAFSSAQDTVTLAMLATF